jgi:hypothetical protein
MRGYFNGTPAAAMIFTGAMEQLNTKLKVKLVNIIKELIIEMLMFLKVK